MDAGPEYLHNACMSSALAAERVRRDVEVLALAGLDLATFMAEVDLSINRVLRASAMCAATIDPTTNLLTSSYKFGDLAGRHERDLEWSLIEYGGDEPTSFIDMYTCGTAAIGMHLETGGDLRRSMRLRDCISPFYGYGDELRVVASTDARVWGACAFFRAPADQPFDRADVEFAASLAPFLAKGFRTGLMTHAADFVEDPTTVGPAVIIVDADDRLRQISLGAEQRLTEIIVNDHSGGAMGTIAALVASARRYASGVVDVLPRGRVRLRSGRWVVLQASPLAGRDGATGDVVITIEDARPAEIVPLLVEAFGLTARERDITQFVLQGAETKEIAAALSLSAYTIQDHLKAIFEKADVHSRRELIAKVFFDQYQPRIGAEIAPNGWFLPIESASSAR